MELCKNDLASIAKAGASLADIVKDAVAREGPTQRSSEKLVSDCQKSMRIRPDYSSAGE